MYLIDKRYGWTIYTSYSVDTALLDQCAVAATRLHSLNGVSLGKIQWNRKVLNRYPATANEVDVMWMLERTAQEKPYLVVEY